MVAGTACLLLGDSINCQVANLCVNSYTHAHDSKDSNMLGRPPPIVSNYPDYRHLFYTFTDSSAWSIFTSSTTIDDPFLEYEKCEVTLA